MDIPLIMNKSFLLCTFSTMDIGYAYERTLIQFFDFQIQWFFLRKCTISPIGDYIGLKTFEYESGKVWPVIFHPLAAHFCSGSAFVARWTWICHIHFTELKTVIRWKYRMGNKIQLCHVNSLWLFYNSFRAFLLFCCCFRLPVFMGNIIWDGVRLYFLFYVLTIRGISFHHSTHT